MACSTFMQERITKTKTLIVAYEDALLALATGGVQEYRLNTGQSDQKVTKMDVKDLQNTVDSLYNTLATLEARCTGNGTKIGRPAW